MKYLKLSGDPGSEIRLAVLLFLIILFTKHVHAFDLYHEINSVTGWSHIQGHEQKVGSQMNTIGFELFRKDSNDFGDFRTIDLQVRLGWDDEPFIQLHNFWVEYKKGLGQYLRVGHLSVAYGIEPLYDSHSTMFQTLAMRNFGLKNDWGVKWRGLAENFDWEASLTTGSGMGLRPFEGTWLLSGRAFKPNYSGPTKGYSLAFGKVLTGSDARTIPAPSYAGKQNVFLAGFDVQHEFGEKKWFYELSAGKNAWGGNFGFLADLQINPYHRPEIVYKAQLEISDIDRKMMDGVLVRLNAGLEFSLTRDSKLGLLYRHDIASPGEKDRAVFLQYYLYGKSGR